MSDKVKLEVEIDLGNLRRYVGSDEDGPHYEPMPLEEAVVAEAGRAIAAKLEREIREEMRYSVKTEVQEALRAALGPMVSEALDQAIQPTNSYGEAKGEPVTLREVIVKTAKEELRDARSRDGYGSRKENLVQEIIRKEVGAALAKELNDAIKDAKVSVLAAVQEKGAEVIAATITKMAGVR